MLYSGIVHNFKIQENYSWTVNFTSKVIHSGYIDASRNGGVDKFIII